MKHPYAAQAKVREEEAIRQKRQRELLQRQESARRRRKMFFLWKLFVGLFFFMELSFRQVLRLKLAALRSKSLANVSKILVEQKNSRNKTNKQKNSSGFWGWCGIIMFLLWVLKIGKTRNVSNLFFQGTVVTLSWLDCSFLLLFFLMVLTRSARSSFCEFTPLSPLFADSYVFSGFRMQITSMQTALSTGLLPIKVLELSFILVVFVERKSKDSATLTNQQLILRIVRCSMWLWTVCRIELRSRTQDIRIMIARRKSLLCLFFVVHFLFLCISFDSNLRSSTYPTQLAQRYLIGSTYSCYIDPLFVGSFSSFTSTNLITNKGLCLLNLYFSGGSLTVFEKKILQSSAWQAQSWVLGKALNHTEMRDWF